MVKHSLFKNSLIFLYYYAILSVATISSAAPSPHPGKAALVVTPLNAPAPFNFLEDVKDKLEPHSAEITEEREQNTNQTVTDDDISKNWVIVSEGTDYDAHFNGTEGTDWGQKDVNHNTSDIPTDNTFGMESGEGNKTWADKGNATDVKDEEGKITVQFNPPGEGFPWPDS